ncbi:14266_t:CDS:2 [Dentiscutata erythropus]|uniref:14266_t:CDS:1 n=1 Tax=Dentiscutata erythropus TaxID=1348616 RepID=A0A9N8WKY0_9GLOM|nr:14266_t:CDS:2 [Dentiscutata erythropus]
MDLKQNQKIFHAEFLDGIRGVAALCVVYEHSQRLFNQSLPFTTFDYVGYLGVRCFFVLSAFLLTFRSMLDWERYHENIEVEKHIGTDARSRCAYESKIDLEMYLTDVPLLSKTTENSSTKTKYNISYKFLSYIQSKIWIKHQIAIKLWLKFFLRRFMRVYPPYAILLFIIAYNDFVNKSYHGRIDTSNLISHLYLHKANFIFWTIPTEMKILGMPRMPHMRYVLELENSFGGFLYAILILISFSIYLLHPIAQTFVNEYLTQIGISGAEKELDKEEKANDILDAVIMSYVLTIILSWLYYLFVEKPSMNLANYITKRWLNEVKQAKSDNKTINVE